MVSNDLLDGNVDALPRELLRSARSIAIPLRRSRLEARHLLIASLSLRLVEIPTTALTPRYLKVGLGLFRTGEHFGVLLIRQCATWHLCGLECRELLGLLRRLFERERRLPFGSGDGWSGGRLGRLDLSGPLDLREPVEHFLTFKRCQTVKVGLAGHQLRYFMECWRLDIKTS